MNCLGKNFPARAQVVIPGGDACGVTCIGDCISAGGDEPDEMVVGEAGSVIWTMGEGDVGSKYTEFAGGEGMGDESCKGCVHGCLMVSLDIGAAMGIATVTGCEADASGVVSAKKSLTKSRDK